MLTEEQKAKAKQYRLDNRDRIAATQRRWVEAHKPQLAAYQKQWKLDHPDTRYHTPEEELAYRQEYYKTNKDRLLAQMKEYRAANPGIHAKMMRKWRADNEGHTYTDKKTGYVKYIGYNHPAANPSGVTAEHRIILWDKLKGKGAMCHWGCGTWVSWDRVHPIDKNALVADHLNLIKDDNHPDNLVPSCAHCNVTRTGGRENKNVPKGEDVYMSILTNTQALEIKVRLLAGDSNESIAKDYPVAPCAINAIRRGKSWTSVGPDVTSTYKPSWSHMTPAMIQESVGRIKGGQTITYVGEAMDRTSSTIARAFKKETGMSVREYKRAFNEGRLR